MARQTIALLVHHGRAEITPIRGACDARGGTPDGPGEVKSLEPFGSRPHVGARTDYFAASESFGFQDSKSFARHEGSGDFHRRPTLIASGWLAL